jgi:hypothetical protein
MRNLMRRLSPRQSRHDPMRTKVKTMEDRKHNPERQKGRRGVDQRMKKFTVLLLRPDHVADGYGTDTYLAHVTAPTPGAAVTAARHEVARVDDLDDVRIDDYHPLITLGGWHDDITPGAFR